MKSFLAKIALAYLVGCQAVFAALPVQPLPAGASAGGGFIPIIKGYFKEGSSLLGLAISVAGFLWLSWIAIADINEARSGRKEWGAVGLTVVVGAGVFAFISYLLLSADSVI